MEKIEAKISGMLTRLVRHYGTQTEVARRLGVRPGMLSKWRSGFNLPDAKNIMRIEQEIDDLHDDDGGDSGVEWPAAVAQIDGRRARSTVIRFGVIPEIDTHLGAGGGGYPSPARVVMGGRTYDADAVRDQWTFPENFVRSELHANFEHLDIVAVRGDSMANQGSSAHLEDGDRVLIDRRDRAIRQGGIFAIRDDQETIIKQVELVRGAEPPRIICTSLNERYKPFELVLDGSAEVIGRAILKLARM